MATMHADEAVTDEDLVRRLLRAQFPPWAHLPVRRLASGGTVNAIYRVGDELSVRLPLTVGGSGDLPREATLLSRLAPVLPVPIPEVVALGEPGEGYPWPWAVHRWIEGDVLVEGESEGASEPLARDLAAFVVAMRKVDLDGGPRAHRGGPLAAADAFTRESIEELRRTDEPFDADAALDRWKSALAVPAWSRAPLWTHSDLMPSNLLGGDGRLSAVLDFGTVGVGDPSIDLIPAWNLLPSHARQVFREEVDVDDDTWARGRGWALSMAVTQLAYYRNSNAVISANARWVLGQILPRRA